MKNYNYLILFLILGLAAFFRFWQLDQIPPGLYPDVAINGNEAIANPGQIFYPENNGREGLWMNLIALSFGIFGISVWSIKAVAAFFGTLTILGTYLLVKELFSRETLKQWSNEAIALLASFFLATSFWHLNFSRFGFRAIMLPLALVFSFYFLFRGLRTKKLFDFALAGIFFGLGFYTYTSFRMAVLLLPIPLLYFWLLARQQHLKKEFLFSIFYFLFSIFIVALPIGIYFLNHPADFASRAAPISVFAQENPLKAFAESLMRHFAMFNFYGDPNWRHNDSGAPQMVWPVGILFLIGIAISFQNIIKGLKIDLRDHSEASGHGLSVARERAEDLSERARRASERVPQSIFSNPLTFLLFWLLVMLLPGALTYEGLPHALRTIGVLPVPHIFAAIGAVAIYNLFLQRIKNKKIVVLVVVVFLSSVTLSGYYNYFIKWAKNPHVQGAFTVYYAKIGEYLNSLPPETKKYVIVNEPGVPVPLPNGLPMPAQTIMFMEWTHPENPQSTYLRPEELEKIPNLPNTVIVPMRTEETLLNELNRRFPQGAIRTENGITVFKMAF